MRPSSRSIAIAQKRAAIWSLFGMLALVAATAAFAESIEFVGTQRPIALGFDNVQGVAVDQYGSLFVADVGTHSISEILAVNGSIPANPIVRTLLPNSDAQCVAVDSNGNVYFTYSDNNSNLGNDGVMEILAVNGSIPASPTVIQLGSGLYFAEGLAVDSHGDIFVADSDHNAIKEMLAVNGSVPVSPTIVTLGSGFNDPRAVALDALGNVYVADTGNHDVKEILAVGGTIPPSPTILTLAPNYGAFSLSLDGQGNLFFSSLDAVFEILAVNGSIPASPAIKWIDGGVGLQSVEGVAVDNNDDIYVGGVFSGTQIAQLYPSDLGPVSVGTSSRPTPVTFSFISSITLGSVSVVTEGAGGMDFADAGTGNCTAGTTYAVYQVCTVNVTFTPKAAGTRFGSVLLKDTNGKVLEAGYVHGTGVAPLVNFAPPTQSALINNVPGVFGVAIDGSGNIYAALTGQNEVIKETLSGGSYVQTVIPTSTLNAPHGVTVDSAGNIFIADTGNSRVLKETPSAAGFVETVLDNGAANPVGVSIDGNGIPAVANQNYRVDIGRPIGGGAYNFGYYLVSGQLAATTGAVTSDASGNIYALTNGTPASIWKATFQGDGFASSTIPLSGVNAPGGLSVDGFGNLYVAYTNAGTSQVAKLTLTSSGYVQSTISIPGVSQPTGIALDSYGNIFIADSGNSQIVKVDSYDAPSLTFAKTLVGSMSTDSPQTVTLQNTGNADLTLPIPSSISNPIISANFTLDDNAPSACPVVTNSSSSSGTVPAGTSCALSIGFLPSTTGSISGDLALTDNNLNAPGPGYALQMMQLAGVAQATPTIFWHTPLPISYGTLLSATQLNATASVPGTFAYTPALGTILPAGTQTLTVTFTPADSTDYTTATASVILTVNKATPVINWPAPAPIISGTALSSTQLNATANVAGTFLYSPAAGMVLPVGTNTLSVAFTPTDATDYSTASASVSLTVNAAPTFSLSASPGSLTVKQGSSTTTAITVIDLNGFTGKVTLATTPLPTGVTASFSTNPTTSRSTLTVNTSNKASTGTFPITVTGTSGNLNVPAYITVTITPRK